MAYLDTTAEGPPTVTKVETLAEGPDIAISEPRFSPKGRTLAYLSDESGWSNLCLYDLQTRTHRPLTSDKADIGRPAWVQGIRSYAFDPDGRHIYYVRNDAGFGSLRVCDLSTGRTRELDLSPSDYTNLTQIAADPVRGRLAFLASSSTTSPQVVSYSPEEDIPVRVHRRSTGETVPSADLSKPQPVSWTAGDGTIVHGLFYRPANGQYSATGLPPAVVRIHGGPTGQTSAAYDPRAQFFATRGYAYLDVNYRGSTGYGKRYMAALRRMWGILDVEDAVGAARYLVEAGLADPERLVIMGGSAGGYTVLQTLVTHPGLFRAALCMYGVSNLFTLAADTHKFEARYLDSLIGPLPKDSALYRDRSPIFHADKIIDPIAVFQGEIDRVVPKAQSETIVASLRRHGIPHEYHVYEGEGHGWRKKETIEVFYKAVEAFLKQHVIFA
jgi:dipeptidyl aminopeptidase/acylaminoacyl peptidase